MLVPVAHFDSYGLRRTIVCPRLLFAVVLSARVSNAFGIVMAGWILRHVETPSTELDPHRQARAEAGCYGVMGMM